ncbi:MAG: ABC transporter permease [Verrucomicrobiales bacterium]|nr:ABC transporter permease [Verrucomicrobiales bacterium]
MNFIALKMLTGERAKYFGLVFAIAFCTFLLENQTSIFAGILKRTGSQILDVTDAEIWVMDRRTEYFEQTKALKDTDLTGVRGVDGVQWAVKLYKGSPVARTLNGKFAVSFCLGLDDATLAGAPRKMLLGSWERLREPNSIIIDHAGYVLLFPGERVELGRTLELNDHKATIVGISDASAPFVSWPVMHARYTEAVNFVGRERTQLSYILVRPKRGVEAKQLCQQIEAQTGLRARTTDEFAWDCIRYYLKNTGIPVNFGITIAIALIVGTVVAGQTFYMFTVENLKQFGALKAIGVTNVRLISMVLLQAFTVGLIGFGLGTGLAAEFFDFLRPETRHARHYSDVAERCVDCRLHFSGGPHRQSGEHPARRGAGAGCGVSRLNHEPQPRHRHCHARLAQAFR